MSSPLVLITGITGFLATHVLDSVLAAPEKYRVRGTLRSKGKADAVLARLKAEDRERVTFVEVADTATSDLSEALKGVTYLLHVASPYQLNVEDAKRDLLEPAIKGTLNALEYAAKEPSVKKVGITSSFAAVTDFSKGGPNRPGYSYTDKDWNPSNYEDAIKAGGAGAFSYSVSKKEAEKSAWDFVETKKPGFELATFCPPMIYAPTLQKTTRKSLNTSSATIYNLISNAAQMPEDRLPLFCDGRDVADAHVAFLSASEPANERFLLWGGIFTWAHAVNFISERHPDLKPRLPKGWEEAIGTIKDKGSEKYCTLDVAPAQKLLGIKFRSWEETLDDTLVNLLELEKQPDWQ